MYIERYWFSPSPFLQSINNTICSICSISSLAIWGWSGTVHFAKNENSACVRYRAVTTVGWGGGGGGGHYVIVSKVKWKPFRLSFQLYPQNDWLGYNFPFFFEVCASAQLKTVKDEQHCILKVPFDVFLQTSMPRWKDQPVPSHVITIHAIVSSRIWLRTNVRLYHELKVDLHSSCTSASCISSQGRFSFVLFCLLLFRFRTGSKSAPAVEVQENISFTCM